MKKIFAALAVALACLTASNIVGGNTAYAQKTTASPAAAPSARKLPMRDAKGRFIKASPAAPKVAKPATGARTLPARDAKGRFIKKGTAPTMAPAAGSTKMTLPARDAKGRFIKKGTAPTAPAPKAP